MPSPRITRRAAVQTAAAGLAVPFVFRAHAHAAPSDTLLHVSVGAGGRAASDIDELVKSPKLKLIAAADVDATKAAALKKKFPDIRTYADWREMFDKEKFDSVNVGTPDHTHAAPTMRALKSGKHALTQKPLTQTIYDSRALTEAAKDSKSVTQMGIQIHSDTAHKTVVAAVQSGVIGKVKEVHSWSGKDWGDPAAKPDRTDPVPATLAWDLWLGPRAERPFIGGSYYHPGNWRKRLDFGCGTFGDMGCHILDPVYGSLALAAPTTVRSEGDAPNQWNWALNGQVTFAFPATKFTTDGATVTWYNGSRRPPEDVTKRIGSRKLPGQGSIYIGTDGVLFSPYIGMPVVIRPDGSDGPKVPPVPGVNHFVEWADAARGVGTASTPFSYSGPLTEMVLLGCLATRFPKTTLDWDAAGMKVTNVTDANRFVRSEPRKGWDEPGL